MLENFNFWEFMVAIGTISLAGVTFLLVIQNRTELKLLRGQYSLQKYQTKPQIIIKNFTVKQNVITTSLKNIGGGLAKDIGLSSTFHLMFKSNNSFHLLPKDDLEFDNKTMKIAESITFLKPDNNFSRILGIGEEQMFTADTIFFELKENKELGSQKFFRTNELIDFLKNLNIQGFGITIGLVYKDLSEDVVTLYSYSAWTFDLDKHHSLEDCFKDNIRPYGLPLSFEELQQKTGFFDGEMYRNFKKSN
jgi:hypothetical protein